jgi:hypothetical protein
VDTEYFLDRFELPINVSDPHMFRTEEGEYGIHVCRQDGSSRGVVIRKVPWGGSSVLPPDDMYDRPPAYRAAKTLSFVEGAQLGIYGAACRKYMDRPVAVLVEDAISALKVSAALGFRAYGVALLGVGLNQEKVLEIQRVQPERVLIALDPDATETAFRLARKWGAAFPSVKVAIMEKDPKDTESGKLREIVLSW